MKDLNLVPKSEQRDFFKSFDQVLCDVDGVLWHFPQKIAKADDAIKLLQNLQKKIVFVSNKTSASQQYFYENLKSVGFDLSQNDLIMPELAIISHLKKINFNKEIFLIGMTSLRNELTNAGFKLADRVPCSIEESPSKFVQMSLAENSNIGAVISDTDVNTNYLQLQKAANFLKNPEVIFITTNSTKVLHAGPNRTLFSPGYFDHILENFTGRKAIRLAKPNTEYNDFVKEKHQIGDPSRVLFIGDSIEDDMAFAANCGYKKLLILSGIAQKEWLSNWKFPEEYKPDYYVDSLTVVHDILLSI